MVARTLTCALALVLTGPLLAAPPDPDSWTDASLRGVFFLDARTGWVVGDRGTLLHTTDGGSTWRTVPSYTACNLTAVWFRDRRRGYVVGGQALPHSPLSNGLVLETVDGGRTWRPVLWGQVPRLSGIYMTDPLNGRAWGESTDVHRSGLFVTRRGPSSWRPVSAPGRRNWLAGAAGPDGQLILGADDGTIAVLEKGKLTPVPALAGNRRAIRAIAFADEQTVWAVGDQGLLLVGHNGGASWEPVRTAVLGPKQAYFDWYAVAAQGPHVWIAGTPGHVVLHSHDGGKSWSVAATGNTLPLYGLHFVSEELGWAVGAGGTILHTRDGGTTWQRVRAGVRRAGIVFLVPKPAQIPHAAVVTASAGYGVATAVVSPYRPASAAEVSRWLDAAAVTYACGVTLGTRLPRPQTTVTARQTAQWLARQIDSDPQAALRAELALVLATWRPEVVVICDPLDGGAHGPLFLEAARATLDGIAPPVPGLEPWRPKRLYVVDPVGPVRFTGAEVLPSAGVVAGVPAAVAQALVGATDTTDPPLRFRLVEARDGQQHLAANGFWVGLGPVDAVRRPVGAEPNDAKRLEALQAAAQARQQAYALTRKLAERPVDQTRLPASLDAVLAGLDRTDAGFLLASLGRRFSRSGRWWLAMQAYGKLLADHPKHLEAPAAWRWLMRFYASEELQVRVSRSGFARVVELAPHPPDSKPQKVLPSEPGETVRPVVVEFDRAEQRAATGPADPASWLARAQRAKERLDQLSPAYAAAPEVMLPHASVLRRLGKANAARAYYATLAHRPGSDAWRLVGQTEQWLATGTGRPGQRPVKVVWGKVPRLDASLDDRLWQQAQFERLQPVSGGQADAYRTEVAFATDGRFLFIAARCRGGGQKEAVLPRQRDAGYEARDRLLICLDVDRDYSIYYSFAIDDRGWGAERCWEDQSWDPTWYMAWRPLAGSGYAVEAAVPLEELCLQRPGPRTAWACNVVRVVPGRFWAALGQPVDDVDRPTAAGFRVLLFGSAVRSR